MTTAVVTVVAAGPQLNLRRILKVRATRMGYAVRPLKMRSGQVVQITGETNRTFSQISDPANAHLFGVDAALEAFASVHA